MEKNQNFLFPYGFHGPVTYTQWLKDAGLIPHRVELIEKDMCHNNTKALAGWINTTWLPYLERVPEGRRESFSEDIIDAYLNAHPAENDGTIHVVMKRLEIEAFKLKRSLGV